MSKMLVAERRFTPRAPELRVVGNSNHITGYASVFNRFSRNLGGFVEQVNPSAFVRSMQDGWPDVICRYNHSDDWLLGTVRGNTLTMLVDDVGLNYDVEPPSFRSDVVELCRRGDVTQSSFAFRCPDGGDGWERRGPGGFPLRTLYDVDAVDVAPVNTPAYPDATASARSLDDGVVMSLARYAEAEFAEVRSYLETNNYSVTKFFKRSDRPSAPAKEEAEMAKKTDDAPEDRKKLTSKERNDLPDSSFAYIDPEGGKHFPIHDAAHVRNALARIAQGAKYGQEALPKVKAAAKKFGIGSEEQNFILDLVAEYRGDLPPWLQKAKDKGAADDSAGKGADDDEDKEDDSADEDAEDGKKKPAARAAGGSDDEDDNGEEARDDSADEDQEKAEGDDDDATTRAAAGKVVANDTNPDADDDEDEDDAPDAKVTTPEKSGKVQKPAPKDNKAEMQRKMAVLRSKRWADPRADEDD